MESLADGHEKLGSKSDATMMCEVALMTNGMQMPSSPQIVNIKVLDRVQLPRRSSALQH